MKRVTLGLLGAAAIGLALFSAAPSFAAELVIGIAPPAVRVEVIPPSPGAEFVWRSGYWNWDGHAHVWVGGEYLRRPRPGALWVAGHWDRRGAGWVWVEGHWR